jgi:putative transposase
VNKRCHSTPALGIEPSFSQATLSSTLLVRYLERAVQQHACMVPIYCFMPDHLHVMIRGQSKDSDARAAMVRFKDLSGKWMSRQKLAGWQGNFYDHIMRDSDDWREHAMYIALNPVRAGLVTNLFDYPFIGSIGCELQDVVLPWE